MLLACQGARGGGFNHVCLACCLTVTQTLLLVYHEDILTHFMRTLGTGDIASLRAVQLDPDAHTYCVLVLSVR